jgi:hypothetical protein
LVFLNIILIDATPAGWLSLSHACDLCCHARYITMEELEQALREKGLLDGRDIKEIVAEVDADNVRK